MDFERIQVHGSRREENRSRLCQELIDRLGWYKAAPILGSVARPISTCNIADDVISREM
jgi:hypothetical protein